MRWVRWVSFLVSLPGCMANYVASVGGEPLRAVSRVYQTDMESVWQATIAALQGLPLEESNREGGFVRTKWLDNTLTRNQGDSPPGISSYARAQYRIKVFLAPGQFKDKESVRVSVFKEQLVQRDILDGLRPLQTDSIEEETLHYRIHRLVVLRLRFLDLQKREVETAQGGNSS
jgi:hypothetical protein